MSEQAKTVRFRKRERNKAQTRARVLAAASILFRSLGFDAVGVRDVAAQAGVSTGAIFANWDSKEELFTEAMGRPPLNDARGAELLARLKTVAPDQAAALLSQWAA